ncbi:sensor histidine kinase [Anaerovorax odorimutans]|uniref:histidine kinase n=1 Tax=Anaerovorax odorimutans TaxID=109327 RepID=A0ABT1RS47_9FIRM|nr:sensor histidine kinase [Anaerovorax odorimutans]MCQ4637992.1 sensor histidine kinase [Anaerovorax odorimutans]
MEKLKKSLVAKITAYILLLACVTMAVFSAAVVLFNEERGWYSKDAETVEKEIYHEAANKASLSLIDQIYSLSSLTEPDAEDYYPEEYGTGELTAEEEKAIEAEAQAKDKADELAAIAELKEKAPENGKENADFGYIVSFDNAKTQEAILIWQANADLKTTEGVYSESFYHEGGSGSYKVEIFLRSSAANAAVPAEVASSFSSCRKMYEHRTQALIACILCLLAAIVFFIYLMVSAGWKNEERRSCGVAKLPLDLMAAAGVILIFAVGINMAGVLSSGSAILIALAVLPMTAVVVGYLLLFAVELKEGVWWKHTVLNRLLHFLNWIIRKKINPLLRQLPLVWKTGVVLAAFLLLNLMAISGGGPAVWLLSVIVLSVAVLYIALGCKRLAEGGKRLAEGDLDYQIDKNGLLWDLAQHADNLNSIGKGMSRAVEERLKSERFKSELITNVSHDIKTPLTSIINYVDFLKKEELDNEKAKEYVEVLDRQSGRLKKLIEDLVDASKAATGNVKLDLVPCQVGVLMTQTMGEYKEKAEESDLNFIMKLPEKELEIMADGRRMWRIFDNLLNNICKYSQPGTRVYLSLEEKDGKAVITYRNTSRYELNISEEELMERFVRGDSSRHTEGSGLGLSIARNLVELQGGTFNIFIDGDLFKVVMNFDLID